MTTLAVDLGGTHMRVAAVADDGTVLSRTVRPTPRDQPCATALVSLVRDFPAGRRVARAVIGVPGRVDYTDGVLQHAPNLPAGWVPSLTRAAMAEVLGTEVDIANDADLAAAWVSTAV